MNTPFPDPSQRFTAIVLAEPSPASKPLQESYGVINKCLIQLDGETMLARILSALKAAPSIASIIVVCNEQNLDNRDLKTANASVTPASSEGPATSVAEAVTRLGLKAPLLITTGDHALLTTTIIETFIAMATRQECKNGSGIHIGVSAETTIKQDYPNIKRTWWRFADGGWSGCNLYAFTSHKALMTLPNFAKIYHYRKSPWKLIGTFSLKLMFAYHTGMLSLDKIAARLTRRFGVNIHFIRLPFAEAAIDGDKVEDLVLMEQVLRQRRNAA